MDINSTINFEEIVYQNGLKILPLKLSITLLNVLLNTIAVLVFSKLKRTFSNLLFISLSLSDLIIGIFFMPLHIVNTIFYYWPFGNADSLGAIISCLALFVIETSQWLPSVLTVLILAVHRFRQLYWPTSVNETVTRPKKLLLVSVWVVPYLVNITRYTVYYFQGFLDISICMASIPTLQFVIYTGLASIAPVLASLIINLANVFGLVRKSLKLKRSQAGSTHRSVGDLNHEWSFHPHTRVTTNAFQGATQQVLRDQSSRRQRRHVKASLCIGSIILNNLINQYPFGFLWPIEILCGWCVPGVFFDTAFLMLLVSPIVNPLLLFVFHDLFQKKLLDILRTCLKMIRRIQA